MVFFEGKYMPQYQAEAILAERAKAEKAVEAEVIETTETEVATTKPTGKGRGKK